MTLRKKIVLGLLIVPLSIILLLLVRPVTEGDQHNGLELLFLVAGLPILIINYLEWATPQTLNRWLGVLTPSPENSSPEASENVSASLPTGGQPAWKFFAILICVLVIGIALGASALSTINQLNSTATTEPAPSPSEELSTPVEGTQSAFVVLPSETATETLQPGAPTRTPGVPTNQDVGASPTGSPTLPIAAATSTTSSNTSRCVAPTQNQFAAIQAGIKTTNVDNEIRKGYVVQSIADDNLWFFAAKIYGPDIQGGVTNESAVWGFYNNEGSPYNIYTVNDTAGEYSAFNFGIMASPPLDMQLDGAIDAYTCAANGN